MDILGVVTDENLANILKIGKYEGNNIEPKAFELYRYLHGVAKSDIKYIYLYLRIIHCENQRDISVNTPRPFKIILLSSLRHLKILTESQTDCRVQLFTYILVKDLFENINLLDYKSLYLLKLLEQIVQKRINSIGNIQKFILNKLYGVCYATPLAPLKNLAVGIINYIESKNGITTGIFKPLQNVAIITNFDDSKSKLSRIKTEEVLLNLEEYMQIVHKFFHFNVHNKTAGILYRSVISRFNIEEFQEYVWPFWANSLKGEADTREFHQSLLKYWIPYSIECYKIDLYTFLCTQKVTVELLVDVLFELRRKRYISVELLYEGHIFQCLLNYLENKHTFDKAIEIICTFPSMQDRISPECLEIIESHLLSQCDLDFCMEKNLNKLLCHIFISEHIAAERSSYVFSHDKFIIRLTEYIVGNLSKEGHNDTALKLCENLVNVMQCPSNTLKLKYTIPKKSSYGFKENRYFLYLQKNGIFNLLTEKKRWISDKLVAIFNEKSVVDKTIVSLLIKDFNVFNVKDLKSDENDVSLHNLEKIIEYNRIILHKVKQELGETGASKYLESSVDKINNNLTNLKICDDNLEEIFQVLIDLNVLVIAHEVMGCNEFAWASSIGLLLLDFMVDAVEDNSHERLSPRTRKVVEHLFCSILNLFQVSRNIREKQACLIFNKLTVLIDKSNIRKLVTDALHLVSIISAEMENSHSCRLRRVKNRYHQELLVSICSLDHLENSKMRKHPKMRALLHAICRGSGQKQKKYVQMAITKMLSKTKEANLNSAIQTVILECLELLVAEPSFHSFTFIFVEEIIELSLKSFESNNWTVKNAAIQLTNALITRFFGIQQTENVRLRSFQEFSMLFPALTDRFYDILSSPVLDDKSIIVLQYISASEVLTYENLDTGTKKKIDKFLDLFNSLLKSSEHFVVKFIPRAFVNLCSDTNYPHYLRKVADFILENFNIKPTNIIVNHLILFKEFIKKINENYSLLKTTYFKIENSIIDTVHQINEFLRNKRVQYLDLFNLRYFVLDQYAYNNIHDINQNISLKKWFLINMIHNINSSSVSDFFLTMFNHFLKSEYNFLMDVFLEHTVDCICKDDTETASAIFNVISTQIFLVKNKNNSKLYKCFIEVILKIYIKFENKIIYNITIPENLGDINFYEAVTIQIICAIETDLKIKEKCVRSFKEILKLKNLNNFELALIPKMSLLIYKNLEFIDKFLFLKFVFYLILVDFENDDIYTLVLNICKKSVNDNLVFKSLMSDSFLYHFLGDKEVILRFLKDILTLIGKFEKNSNFCTFYMDTYDTLQGYKDIVRSVMTKI